MDVEGSTVLVTEPMKHGVTPAAGVAAAVERRTDLTLLVGNGTVAGAHEVLADETSRIVRSALSLVGVYPIVER